MEQRDNVLRKMITLSIQNKDTMLPTFGGFLFLCPRCHVFILKAQYSKELLRS